VRAAATSGVPEGRPRRRAPHRRRDHRVGGTASPRPALAAGGETPDRHGGTGARRGRARLRVCRAEEGRRCRAFRPGCAAAAPGGARAGRRRDRRPSLAAAARARRAPRDRGPPRTETAGVVTAAPGRRAGLTGAPRAATIL